MTSVKVEDHPLERIYDVLEVSLKPRFGTLLVIFSGLAWPYHQDPHLSLPKVLCNHIKGSRRRSVSWPGGWEGIKEEYCYVSDSG